MIEREGIEEGKEPFPDAKRSWREQWMAFWPNLRAVLVLFHVITVIVLGFPAPAGVTDRSSWNDPSVKDEMRIAASRARAIGFDWTDKEFEDVMFNLAKKYNNVRGWVLKPFKPYAAYCGVRQSWRMFSAPHRYPTRLHIDLEQGDEWVPIYVGRSDEYDWMRKRFDHHRLRRIAFLHGWKKYRRSYRGFTKWVAREAARDFPKAKRIRVRQFKQKSQSPEDVAAGKVHTGKFQNQRIQTLKRAKP